MFRRIALKSATALCFGMAVLAGSVQAQQPLGYVVTQVEVEPGAAGQFETFVRNYKAAAEAIDWPTAWTASQIAVGNTNSYTFVSAFTSHSQLSVPSAALLSQAHSADEVVEIVQDLRESVKSLVTGTYYLREDLSNPFPQAMSNPEVFVTIGVNIEPGTNLDFEYWIQRVADASDSNFWNGLVKGYGEGFNYVFRTPTSWAALDQAPTSPQQRVLDQYGPIAGTAITDLAAGSAVEAVYNLVVNRPELSYTP
ncbi:MAG: hypothetical protein O2861_03535 [Proteobacteria bacterium]|nr:hypothetical protein [Pseudomonadota bacterium]